METKKALGSNIRPINSINPMFITQNSKEKQKHYCSTKLTDPEKEMLDDILQALDSHSNSYALRWCVREAYEKHKEEIDAIVEEKKKIRTL